MKLKDNHKSFRPALAGRRWFYVELPAMEYSEAWNLQCQFVASRKDRIIDTDIVLCLEHPPVFTLGRRGGLGNLKVTEEFLKKAQTIFPDSPEYYSTSIQINLLKYISFNENTKNIAINLALEAINKYPYHPELFAIVGYCYYLKFGEDGNKVDFDKALELNESSYFLRPNHINNIVYAELLMLNREYDKAIASFQRALKLKPRDYSLWNKLGATQANSIQSADAILAYQQVS